jgi:pimeloyl-ACP methyl ester carboxylesterase
MSENIDYHRRRFLSTAAGTIAGSSIGVRSPSVQTNKTRADVPPNKPRSNTSFAPIKQISARLLSIGYAEAGPAGGPAVILLHGWPYDIHSYVDVAPLLASSGYRVIVPCLRGYGSTRFLSNETFRNGQQSAVALDIITLMDALKINKAIFGGFDWGARTVDIIAALWPERCKGIVAVTGYLITNIKANQQPLRPRPNGDGGTSIIFPRNAASSATANTHTSLTSLSGRMSRRNGTSMMLHTIAPLLPSRTPITSTSSSIITAGDWAWQRASHNMTS